MKWKTRTIAVVAAAGVSFFAVAQGSVPAAYSANATFGTVVDPSGKPIEGAVVVAQWVLQSGANGSRSEILVVREAITDSSGQFRIEAWGPVQRPAEGSLDVLDPEVIVVKPGGLFWVGSNYGLVMPGEREANEKRDWLRNGSTIRLQSVKAGATDLEKQNPVYGIWAFLRRVMKTDDCKWTQVPRAMASLEKDFARLGRISPEARGSDLLTRTDCGSLVEFRRAYEGIRDRSP